MYKSALIFILAASLVTGLSACGGSSEKNTEVEPPVTIPPVTPVEPTVDHSGLAPLSADVIEKGEHLSGGETTVFVSNENAFSRKPAAIVDDFQLDGHFTSGDHLFRTPDNNIGPILSTGSCQGCHLNDGRGVVPASPAIAMSSMLVKLADANGNADPIYGDQIQPLWMVIP